MVDSNRGCYCLDGCLDNIFPSYSFSGKAARRHFGEEGGFYFLFSFGYLHYFELVVEFGNVLGKKI